MLRVSQPLGWIRRGNTSRATVLVATIAILGLASAVLLWPRPAATSTEASSSSSVMVCNLDQPPGSSLKIYIGERGARFQAFTTGNAENGYLLRKIQVQIHPPPQPSYLTVSVLDNYENNLFDLVGPTIPEEIYPLHFTFSGDHVLQPSTTYKLAFRHKAREFMLMSSTASAVEDDGAVAGWSLADNSGHLGESGQDDLPEAVKLAIWAAVATTRGATSTPTPTPTPTPTVTPTPTPPPPLTGKFISPPEHHDGATMHLVFRFSEEVPHLSWRTVRDELFDARGGNVSRVKRERQGSNRGWRVWVSPDSADSDICIDINGDLPDCDTPGSVCTADGRPLSFVPHLAITDPRTE